MSRLVILNEERGVIVDLDDISYCCVVPTSQSKLVFKSANPSILLSSHDLQVLLEEVANARQWEKAIP